MGEFDYFGEREGAPEQRRLDNIGEGFWGGIVAEIDARLNNGSFAADYPRQCPEYPVTADTNREALGQALRAEHQQVAWPLDAAQLPATLAILEAIEFFHHHVSHVTERRWHDYYRHYHLLEFDREQGQREFRELVNRLFRRNQLTFEITAEGKIRRLIQGPLAGILPVGLFNTGDGELDRLLRQARDRFLSPDIEVRRDALEKLWDSFERMKTLLDPDKQRGIQALLQAAVADEPFRELLNVEGRSLTAVGNQFMIRHMEVDKVPIADPDYVDYLFQRMFSLIWVLLKRTGRL